MSIRMRVGASKAQAASTRALCRKQIEDYRNLQSAINDFLLTTDTLKGEAYKSARAYFDKVLKPLGQGGMLLAEAVEKAVQKFPDQYQAEVDHGDLDEAELESKIAELKTLISSAQSILNQISDVPVQGLPGVSTTNNSLPALIKEREIANTQLMISGYEQTLEKLKILLRKLRAFNAKSSSIFKDIDVLKQAVDQGLEQTKTSWDGIRGVFLIPDNLDWANTIQTHWQMSQDELHGIDPKLNQELKKYRVYAIPYTNHLGEPDILWQIEDLKTGNGIDNYKLYRYLEKSGKYLGPELIELMSYDAYENKVKAGWRKGVNYATGERYNRLVSGTVSASQNVADGIDFLNNSGLGTVLEMLGFAYASYKLTTASGVKEVAGGKGISSKINQVDFSSRVSEHLNDPDRYVPIQLLEETIEIGNQMPDPRGSSAAMFYSKIEINGSKYNLEVLYDKNKNLIYHFKYSRRPMGPLPEITKFKPKE
ncbi:transposase [Xylocopilactobacillus apicola]|uniref:LXG domain-containing protein n=1 Tax=Xylocopilactobacillus apicola TaxID=2932184 RepID=A0AAU9DL43_9LACO|nr:transposase [Xylocopilactobacillus apicola]BDR59266.1 hypothetical protein XA3_17070 [Xylocopilactobacillus apicola]